MKGVSDIIAVLLMLIITIGLAGAAYFFISGIFTSRTAVVLSIDATASSCAANNGAITVFVRNDGTQASGSVTATVTAPSGTAPTCASISSIAAGTEASLTCGGTGQTARTGGAGNYNVRVVTSNSAAEGAVYCVS